MPGCLPGGAPSRDISFKLLKGLEFTGIRCCLLKRPKICFIFHVVLAESFERFAPKNIDRLATDCRLSCYEFCISAPAKTSGKKLGGEREGADKKRFLPQIVRYKVASVNKTVQTYQQGNFSTRHAKERRKKNGYLIFVIFAGAYLTLDFVYIFYIIYNHNPRSNEPLQKLQILNIRFLRLSLACLDEKLPC